MSRFDAPFESPPSDDLDFPTFEPVARRHSRPTSSKNPASSRPRSGARPASQAKPKPKPRTDFDEMDEPPFEDAFADSPRQNSPFEAQIQRPARAKNRPATDSEILPVRRAAKRGEKPISRPKTTPPRAPQNGETARNGARKNERESRPRDGRFGFQIPTPRAIHFEIGGVLLVASGAILGYYALQNDVDGALPDLALRGLKSLFGVGTIAVPLALLFAGFSLLIKRQNAHLRAFLLGGGTAFLVFLTFKHLQLPRGAEFSTAQNVFEHGGYIGGAFASVLRRALGEIGALIALGAFSVVALLLWSERSLRDVSENLREKIGQFFGDSGENLRQKKADLAAARAHKRALRESEARELEAAQWDEFEDERAQFSPRRPEKNAPRNAKNSPFLSVDDLLEDEEFDAENSPIDWSRPEPENEFSASGEWLAREAADDETRFFESQRRAAQSDANLKSPPQKPRAQTPIPNAPAPAVDPDSTIENPTFLAPRIEFANAAPPPSVVETVATDSVGPSAPKIAPEIDLKAVVAGENADEILTPQEELERQALESASEDAEIEVIKAPEKPRRSFGDGPLMPEYFDDAVRALDPPIPVDNTGAEAEIELAVSGVTDTLKAFKIDARVTDVKRGPVITRYEVQPGAGVRVASIANLDKDLARSLSALAVRIEAPVPGKNVVGIEIPNKKVHLVRMRDVLEQTEFLAHQSKIAFVLGKDIAGQPKWADLAKMPHMLIAGATNSGKSVCLNTIIASILVRARPDEVRFSLIDPKRVELTLYRGIRHLMHDVVVEPKQAVVALKRAIEEMDRRYKLFALHQVRNIASYNAKMEATGGKKMPFIVIVIDELADLMMTAAAEFEKLICRLAQLARATGIHLIVATQRPSVNVITGVIKANIPARIAFAVASQVDSRTILDSVGAERLIGMGDMLFDSNNGGKAVRIQGAFLSEEECNRIVEVVKATYQYVEHEQEFEDLPTFDLYTPDDEDTDFEAESFDKKEEKRDALFDQIVEFCLRHQEMSASNIQRKFGIGYPRAGRIVDQLERAGILGPADGPKPRKVLGRPQVFESNDEE